MSLKLKVEKLEDVAEAQRALYIEDKENGGFILAIEGLEDTGALKRAKAHEVELRKAAEAEAKTLKDAQKAEAEKARKAAEDAAAARGDVEALRKSAEERVAAARAEAEAQYKPQLDSLTNDVDRLLRQNVASSIAQEIGIAGSQRVLLPHILDRLAVDVKDGQRITVVKDASGKPSALTLDDLKKEFTGNKEFAPLIVGSKASGGGAGGGKGGGAAGAKTKTRAEWDAMGHAERGEFSKSGGSVVD